MRPLCRRGWIGSWKEKEGVNERVLKAANMRQWMDMDMGMDKGMDMDTDMDMGMDMDNGMDISKDMEMLGSRNKGKKGHGSPAIDLSRHQPDMSPVQPML